MNVKSKYKKKITEKKNKSVKTNNKTKENNIVVKDNTNISDILPSKILLDDPKNIFQKSKVYKYEIEKNLETKIKY